MTLDDGIKIFERMIKNEEEQLVALDGLPGIYTSKEDFDNCYHNIDVYKQFLEWLQDYKKLKNLDKN